MVTASTGGWCKKVSTTDCFCSVLLYLIERSSDSNFLFASGWCYSFWVAVAYCKVVQAAVILKVYLRVFS